MYAVFVTGGKQYRVAEGDVIRVEKLDAEVGDEVELDQVLLVAGSDQPKIGNPYVDGARVVVKVLLHGKGKKVVAFRYKPKKNVRVRRGHRQPYTEVEITSVG